MSSEYFTNSNFLFKRFDQFDVLTANYFALNFSKSNFYASQTSIQKIA